MARIFNYTTEILCLIVLLVNVVLASDCHMNLTECDSSSAIKKNSTKELKTVLRKCCNSGERYDRKIRTCVGTNETVELDDSSFDFLSGNETGFDGILVGMPNCSASQVLIDITMSPDSYEDIYLEEFKLELLCVERDVSNVSLVGRRCVNPGKICGKIPCIRKCCRPGAHMKGKLCTKVVSDRGFNVTFYDEFDVKDNKLTPIDQEVDFGLFHRSACKEGKYPLRPEKNINETFYVSQTGILLIPKLGRYLPRDEFCLENVYHPLATNGMDGMYAFVCFQEKNQTPIAKWELKYSLIGLGLIVSCVFLFATFLVYLLLPALQNVHGMTLMCHVASFLLAFLCLATVQIGFVSLNEKVCIAIGFVMLFAFLASFAWMNIMCFDIWWTFGGVLAVNHSSRKRQIRKKFAWYSLYAWGVPVVITSAAICTEFVPGLSPKAIKPNMGENTCWFQKGEPYSMLLFFIGPIAGLIACNVVLFVMTARNCSRVKSEINRMQKSTDDRCKKKFQADKEKLVMNGKLFIVMGVSWTIEVITIAIPEKSLPIAWTYIPDTFNALQGVAIFAIFVLKAKVLNALADRLGIKRKETVPTSPNNASCNRHIRDPFNQTRKTSASSTCATMITTVGAYEDAPGRASS